MMKTTAGRLVKQMKCLIRNQREIQMRSLCVCVSLVAQNISSCHSHTFFIYRTIFGALKRVPFIAVAVAVAVAAAAECALFL